jgi:hypothetical protein
MRAAADAETNREHNAPAQLTLSGGIITVRRFNLVFELEVLEHRCLKPVMFASRFCRKFHDIYSMLALALPKPD